MHTCDCCGGQLPPREIWEANRDHAGECTGSIEPQTGRCRAYADDDLWSAGYSLISTSSGYGVRRANGDIAEFLDSDEADEARNLMESGAAEEDDYEWYEASDLLD